MKAFIVEHLGEQGTLQNVSDPIPGDQEVVIRITAAGINPVDWKLRDLYDRPRPFTLGQDFAGQIVGVGNGVYNYRQGDRVFGIARNNGAYAELTTCPINDHASPLSHIPNSVGDSDAASVPTPGLTAMACFEKLHMAAGSRIAIIGATGALGQIAVQLARNNGFHVTGVGSVRHERDLRELGVTDYVAHDTQNHAAVIAKLQACTPQGFDAVLDTVSNAEVIASFAPLLRVGGSLISTNRSIDENAFDSAMLHAINVNLDGSRAASHEGLRNLAKMLETNAIRAPRIIERDFSDALQALDQVKNRSLHEKVVLTFG